MSDFLLLISNLFILTNGIYLKNIKINKKYAILIWYGTISCLFIQKINSIFDYRFLSVVFDAYFRLG